VTRASGDAPILRPTNARRRLRALIGFVDALAARA
jgi:hypothetical protein